jgi:hypothetical protein
MQGAIAFLWSHDLTGLADLIQCDLNMKTIKNTALTIDKLLANC